MAADLLMIVPSRGRPGNVAALLEAWAETATGAADIVIALDADDPEWSNYKELGWRVRDWPQGCQLPLRWTMKERLRLGGTLNEIARHFAPSWEYRPLQYRAIGFMGDDHRPRTKGWDRRMVEALDELGTGMVYGDDLLQRAALPTAVAMTSNIVQALGYMCPPALVHMFLDNSWKAWGDGIGRLRYLSDVIIEHLHPVAGKASADARYTEVWQLMEPDAKRWEEYQASGQLASDIEKLRGLL